MFCRGELSLATSMSSGSESLPGERRAAGKRCTPLRRPARGAEPLQRRTRRCHGQLYPLQAGQYRCR